MNEKEFQFISIIECKTNKSKSLTLKATLDASAVKCNRVNKLTFSIESMIKIPYFFVFELNFSFQCNHVH